MKRKRNRSPLGRGPGDPLGSFQSLGKNLAPQGETSPSRRRAAKKFNDKFQFTRHLNQPKGCRTKFFAKLSFKKAGNSNKSEGW